MLKIRNLRKTFYNSKGEVNNLISIKDFTLESGKQIAVKGSSGCGKTTFLNLISGILKADSGNILLVETDITLLSESKRDKFRSINTGYIFQSFNLLQGYTAIENVMLGMMFAGKPDRKISFKALEDAGLGDKINLKPSELSTGEQQRVSAVRALVNNPKILLADEPTSNLDPENSANIINLIKNNCKQKNISLLIVTHDPEVLSHFDEVINFSEINIQNKI